jgi:hypothetical protein
MRKNSTVVKNGNKIFKQPALTIGLDLGDRTSCYCILDELGNVILERSVPTTSNGIRQAFGKMPRSRIALETGTHSPCLAYISHLNYSGSPFLLICTALLYFSGLLGTLRPENYKVKLRKRLATLNKS